MIKKYKYALLLALLLFLLLAFDQRLKVQVYTVKSDKVHSPLRIALITDLHSCKYGRAQTTLITAIQKENPDLILFGGDICDEEMPLDNVEALLGGIASDYPCYYVTGNHEHRDPRLPEILDLLTSYGVVILDGETANITIGEEVIQLCGLSDPQEKVIGSTLSLSQQLEAVEEELSPELFTLLLSHRPEEIELYNTYGFDLILSGHAHGGQWRIPLIMNGLYAPNQGLFPKYAGGKYDFSASTFIVSRGLARETTPLPRIFNRPELVIINLGE